MYPQYVSDLLSTCGRASDLNLAINGGITKFATNAVMFAAQMFSFTFRPYMDTFGFDFNKSVEAAANQATWALNNATANVGNSLQFNQPYSVGSGNGSSGGSKSSNLSEEEQENKDKFDDLESFLNDYIKYLKNDDDKITARNIERRLKAIKAEKITWEEKLEKLQKYFDEDIDHDDFKNYIVSSGYKLKIDNLPAAEVHKLLKSCGHSSYSAGDYTDVAEAIRTAISNLSDSNGNVDALNNAVAVDLGSNNKNGILGIISAYNSKDSNLIDDFVKQYDKLTKDDCKNTAAGNVEHLIIQLKSQARKYAGSKNLDTESKTLLNTKIGALDNFIQTRNGGQKYITDTKALAKAFNELYVAARLASIKIIEKAMTEKYGSLDSAIFCSNSFLTEETINDLNDESLSGVDISGISAGMKVSASRTRKNGGSSSNTNLDSKPSADQLETLTGGENPVLEKVDDAKCDGKQVYKTTSGKEHYYILADDGKFYEVELDTATNVYTKKDAVKASDIKTQVETAEKIEEADKAITEATKNDGSVMFTPEASKYKVTSTISDLTKDNEYKVYSIEIGGVKHYFVVNDKGNYQKVEVTTSNEISKAVGSAYNSIDALKTMISQEETKLKATKKEKLIRSDFISENQDSPKNSKLYDILSGENGVKIEQNNWTDKTDEFMNNFETIIMYKLKYDGNKTACQAYSEEEWNKALDTLRNYLMFAFEAMDDTHWKNDIHNRESKKVGNDFVYKNESTGQDVESQDQSYASKNKGETRVRKNVSKYRGNKSDTGIYVQCNYNWFIRNQFFVSVNIDEIFDKFKSFLPD